MERINVVIPTTCEAGRWVSLNRAISSVQSQTGVDVEVIVVVNGNRFDAKCLHELKKRRDLKVVYQELGSLPLALRFGRSLVDAPAFAFLDDDDEYLPKALWHRAQPLRTDPMIDFSVSNGYRCVAGSDSLHSADPNAIRSDPLQALSTKNWLASCGGLFRSSSVSLEYFDGTTAYFEWTFLAYKLASTLKMEFVDVPTFRIHDSVDSLSKTDAYRKAEAKVLGQILELELPRSVRRSLKSKCGSAYHSLSSHHLQKGSLSLAWRYHLTSLFYPGRARYILYTRKLLPFWPLRTSD